MRRSDRLSVEPMREELRFSDLSMFDWVVIGAPDGNLSTGRKGRTEAASRVCPAVRMGGANCSAGERGRLRNSHEAEPARRGRSAQSGHGPAQRISFRAGPKPKSGRGMSKRRPGLNKPQPEANATIQFYGRSVTATARAV